MRDKADKLLQTIDELQASDASNTLSARRAERELHAERERAASLERELEGWKIRGGGAGGASVGGSLRVGRGPVWRGVGGLLGPDMVEEDEEVEVEVPKRKSSIGRVPSMTKGFL